MGQKACSGSGAYRATDAIAAFCKEKPGEKLPPLLITNGQEGLGIDQKKIDQIIFDRYRHSRSR
jgi:hypothetical protein